MRENRPPLRVPRRPRMLIEPLFHARHPSPPTENAAVSGAHGETFSPCVSPGGGTASRRRRERRSKALRNSGLAIPATERQATAHCSVRGRAGACRRGRRARRRGGLFGRNGGKKNRGRRMASPKLHQREFVSSGVFRRRSLRRAGAPR